MSQHTELIASLRAESDELIKYQFSHTKEAMSCLQRLHDLSLEAADALQALERVPMTDREIDACLDAAAISYRRHRGSIRGQMIVAADEHEYHVIRAAEAHHGITPPESKG